MKVQKYLFTGIISLLMTLIVVSVGNAEEIKQGDKITIVTPGTMARLCPYPNVGQNQHITRIPKGTVLVNRGRSQLVNL